MTDVHHGDHGNHNVNDPHFFFVGPTVRALVDQLIEYGPDTARLSVYVHGKTCLLRVRSASGEDPGPFNEAHICPGDPACP